MFTGHTKQLRTSGARLITGTRVYEHLPRQLLLARAGLDRLDDRCYVKCGIIGFKLIYRKERLPGHLTAYAEVWLGSVPERTSSMNSRSQSNSTALRLPRPQTEILKASPFYHCFTILNSIPMGRMRNKPCDVTECVTTVAEGELCDQISRESVKLACCSRFCCSIPSFIYSLLLF